MAGARTVVDYISDDGQTYRYRMDSSNATALGNEPAESLARLPSGYLPRYVLATHPTSGQARKLVVCNPEAPLWVGSVAAITIESFATSPSAQVAHGVFSRVGERRLNR